MASEQVIGIKSESVIVFTGISSQKHSRITLPGLECLFRLSYDLNSLMLIFSFHIVC
jgi:hypothetical protein